MGSDEELSGSLLNHFVLPYGVDSSLDLFHNHITSFTLLIYHVLDKG